MEWVMNYPVFRNVLKISLDPLGRSFFSHETFSHSFSFFVPQALKMLHLMFAFVFYGVGCYSTFSLLWELGDRPRCRCML